MNTKKIAPNIAGSRLVQMLKLVGKKAYLKDEIGKPITRFQPKAELKALKKWVAGHCHTANDPKTQELFELLVEHYPNFDVKVMRQEFLVKKLFPDLDYDQKSNSYLRKIMARLTKITEEFFIFQRARNDNSFRVNILIKEFGERRRMDWSVKMIQQEIALMEKKEGKSADDFLDLALLYRHLFHEISGKFRYTPAVDTLTQVEVNLENHFFLQKAILAIEKQNNLDNANSPNAEYSHEMLIERDIRLLSEADKKKDYISFTFSQLLNILTNNDMSSIKSMVADPNSSLGLIDRKLMLIWLINHSIRGLHLNQWKKKQDLLELYKFGLERNLLTQFGQMSDRTFFNIVTISNQLQEFAFSERFINQYSAKLESYLQVSARIWAEAHCLFSRGDIRSCQDKIIIKSPKYHLFSLQLRILQVKAGLELFWQNPSEPELLTNYINASLKWISTDEIASIRQKTIFKNFLNFVRKIIKTKQSPDDHRSKKERLTVSIDRETLLHSRKWLQAMVEKI